MTFELKYPDLYFAHKLDTSLPKHHPDYVEHFHTIHEMLYFVRGDAEFIIEGQRYIMHPGDIYYSKPGEHHNINQLSDAPYERYVIKFPEHIIPPELNRVIRSKNGCFNAIDTKLPQRFMKMDDDFADFTDDNLRLMLTCTCQEIIIGFSAENPTEELYPEKLNESVYQAIVYINTHLDEPFSLQDVCAAVHRSKSNLCKDFMNCVNVPIMQFAKTKRILYAASLIQNGMNPTHVFEKCGFSDYSTFYRSYKQYFGKSPSQK